MTDPEARDLVRAFDEGRLSRRQVLVRGTALGLSMSSLAALIAACGGSGDSGTTSTAAGPVDDRELSGQITMMKGPHAANEAELEQRIISEFASVAPGVDVEFTTYDWAQMNAQLNSAFASSSPPDVFYLTDGTYPFYAQQGVIADLTERVEAPDYAAEWEQVYPFARDLGTYDGKVWGVPVLGAVYLIVVNKDLLARTGVEDWDSSYDRMREAAQKATQGDVHGFAMRTGLSDYAYWDWFPYMHNADADVLSPDLTAPGLLTADSPDAMQFLIDLHQKYRVTPPVGEVDWQGLRDLFRAGRIAIMHDDSTVVPQLLEREPGFEWDVAMVPAGPQKNTVMGNFGFLCIAEKSKNKEAAWAFVKHWASAPQVTRFAQATALQVVRKDVDVDAMWSDNPPMARVQREFVPKVQGLQAMPRMQEMLTGFWPRIEAAYRGQVDGRQALEQANEVIQGVLG